MGCQGIGIHLRLSQVLPREQLVDAGGVLRSLYLRLIRHLMLLILNLPPVNTLKERVTLQIGSVILRANSLLGVPLKQLLQKTGGFLAEVRLHRNRFLSDISQHLLAVTVVVGRPPAQHLVEQGAQAPPVGAPGVTGALDDFGGEVLGGAAETMRLIRLLNTLLRQSEVSDSNVPLRIQEDVLGLQVPVNNVLLVERIDGADYLGCIKFRALFREPLLLPQISE